MGKNPTHRLQQDMNHREPRNGIHGSHVEDRLQAEKELNS